MHDVADEHHAEDRDPAIPVVEPAEPAAASTAPVMLRVNRWRRFGNDRLYVVDAEEANVGWIDLLSGVSTLEQPELASAFGVALSSWLADHPETIVADRADDPSVAEDAAPHVDRSPPSAPRAGAITAPRVQPNVALPVRMAARHDGTCAACGEPMVKGSTIYWSKAARVAVCPACMAYEGVERQPGQAGGGAQQIADRAGVKHAAAVRAAFPELADAIVELNRAPNHVHSWAAGADGERVVGRTLDRMAEKRGDLLVLHDRMIPETGGNIDHIVVGPKRVGVLDAKNYRGKKVRVPHDGEEALGRRLLIDGRDCTQLAAEVRLQAARVSETMAAIVGPTFLAQPYLVFVNAKFGLLGSPNIRTRGVWCMPPDEAATHVAYRGPMLGESFAFDAERRTEMYAALAARFPASRT